MCWLIMRLLLTWNPVFSRTSWMIFVLQLLRIASITVIFWVCEWDIIVTLIVTWDDIWDFEIIFECERKLIARRQPSKHCYNRSNESAWCSDWLWLLLNWDCNQWCVQQFKCCSLQLLKCELSYRHWTKSSAIIKHSERILCDKRLNSAWITDSLLSNSSGCKLNLQIH